MKLLNKLTHLTLLLSLTGCAQTSNPNYIKQSEQLTFKTKSYDMVKHLTNVQNLIENILPSNNSYDSSITGGSVTWVDEGTPTNATVCSNLVVRSLKKAYTSDGLTENVFKSITSGKSSPNVTQFYNAFVNGVSATDVNTGTSWKYEKQLSINNFQSGDLISIDYMDSDNGCPLDSNPSSYSDSSSATGHMAIFESKNLPIQTTIPGTNIIANKSEISILDSSSSYHGKSDTRYTRPDSISPFITDNGVGRGTMILYTDINTGSLLAYKWSNLSNNTCFPQQRRILVARLIKF